MAYWCKNFRYGDLRKEDDGKVGSQFGSCCARIELLHERGKCNLSSGGLYWAGSR